MKLLIRIKNVFGTDRIYPANDTAHKFIALLETKTFSKKHLEIIKSLGCIIEQTQLNMKENEK